MYCGICAKEMDKVKSTIWPIDMSNLTDYPEKTTIIKVDIYQCVNCKVQSSFQEEKTYIEAPKVEICEG